MLRWMVSIVVLLVLLVGVREYALRKVRFGVDDPPSPANELKIGMTSEQAIATMGEPESRSLAPCSEDIKGCDTILWRTPSSGNPQVTTVAKFLHDSLDMSESTAWYAHDEIFYVVGDYATFDLTRKHPQWACTESP